MEKVRKQIIDLVKRSNRILMMPSTPVDGDSIGSSLALYLVFKKMGKQVTVVCADPVPEAFKFLPTTKVVSDDFSMANDFIVTLDCKKAKINTIKTKLEHDKVNVIITAKKGQFSKEDVSFDHGPSKYDLIFTVDTADLEQLGRFYEDNAEIFTKVPLINIDHHASNGFFGKLNYVDIMASATTEILIPLIKEMEKEMDMELMDEDIATLLLAGIITDTGSFQNANTSPRSFSASAQLIKYGARQQEIIKHVFKTKNLSTLKLWGRILSKIKVDDENKIVWSTISKKDLHDTESTPDETGGIIDELLSNAPGSEIVVLIKEKGEGIISGSVRTPTSSVDASAVAEMFGGGGHTQAAGFKIDSDNLEESEKLVIEKIQQFQKKRNKNTMSTYQEEDKVAEVVVTTDTKGERTEGEQTEGEHTVRARSDGFAGASSGKKVTRSDGFAGASSGKKEVKKMTKVQNETEDESSAAFIIKKNSNNKENTETDLEDDVIYKFED